VLRWCAAVAPGAWFPADHAARFGLCRTTLDEPLWTLRQTGLVEVADWVRGVGQGFTLTDAGRRALAELPPGPPPPPVEAPVPQPVGLTAYDRGELTREAFLAPGPAVVGTGLVLVNLGWFLVGLVAAWRSGVPIGAYLRDTPAELLLKLGAAAGPNLLAGEWWRLVTAGFVHPGGLPLVGDLFALALLGPVAEGLWGRPRFLALYLIAAFAGTVTAVALHPDAAVTEAAGAAWGVQAAVIAWLARFRDHLPADALAGWVRRLAAVAGVNALCNLSPGVSYEGLIAGGLTGFVAAVLLDRTRAGLRWRWRLLGAAGVGLLPMALAGGLVGMMRFSPDWAAVRTPPDPSAERAGLLAAVAPDKVRRAEQLVLAAARNRSPEADAEARAAVDALTAGSSGALARTSPTAGGATARFRMYAVAVGRFADGLRAELAADRPPTAADEQRLEDRRAELDRLWRTVQK
jgi:membrane associated rhomboid family serine protease